MSTEREERFSDWAPIKQLCRSGAVSAAHPFYAGAAVETRMALVREAIDHIRLNWDQYSGFMRALQDLIERGTQASDSRSGDRRMADLFSSVKDWVDERSVPGRDDYSAIRLYTSQDGYDQIFGAINFALRTDEFAHSDMDLRAAVFLIELLNIACTITGLLILRPTSSWATSTEGCVSPTRS